MSELNQRKGVETMRLVLLFAPLTLGLSASAFAQSAPINLRVDKLEKEMHAVQRKVFPNGAPVEPEIAPQAQNAGSGSAASAPLADVTQRVDLLEAQVKTLTGQVEQDSIRLRHLDDAGRALDARIKALEAAQASAAPKDTAPSTTTVTPATATKPSKIVKTTPAATPAKPVKDSKREALVAAVAIPDTGDAAEDSYTYGYRLFSAKLYPEAEVKLLEFVTKYPKSKRFTFAQNLLGRAYFEEGKYANAAKAFVENYTKMPKGERAPESLSWAGVALTKDGLPTKACRVYQEFADVYGTKAPREAQDRVAKGRVDAKCTG